MPHDASDLIASAEQARREQRLDDAYREFQRAAALSRTPGSEQHLILALTGLGQIARDRADLGDAQQHYADALAVCRHHSPPLVIAHIARHLGDIYRENGLPAEGEPLLMEAIAIYRQDPNTEPLDLANAIRPLALLKTELGEIEVAHPLWDEALVLYTVASVPSGIAECSAQLARHGT